MTIRPASRGSTASAGVAILIILALGLCGMCAYQWAREARLRLDIEGKNKQIGDLHQEKAAVEALGKRFEQDIKRLEDDKTKIQEVVATNKAEVSRLKAERAKWEFEADKASKQSELYKEAFTKATNVLAETNLGIRKMNDDYRKLGDERNEIVKRYNDLAKEHEKVITEFNDVVTKYNDLVKQIQAQQEKDKDKK